MLSLRLAVLDWKKTVLMPHTLCETQGLSPDTSHKVSSWPQPTMPPSLLCCSDKGNKKNPNLAEVVYYFEQEIKPHNTFKAKHRNSYAAGPGCLIWLQKTQILSWYGSAGSTWCARLRSEGGTGEMTDFTHLLYTSLWAWCRLVTLMSTQWCYRGLLDNASGVSWVELGILRSCIRPNLCTDDRW